MMYLFSRAGAHAVTIAVVSTLVILTAGPAASQTASTIEGHVTTEDTGQPVPGANVVLAGTMTGVATDTDGAYRLAGLVSGRHVIRVTAVGFREVSREVVLTPGETRTIDFTLTEQAVGLQGVEVSALRPTLDPQDDLSARKVRETHAPEAGALMRALPGLDAGRRGALGLDPNVRGFVETEVGAYIDGVRFFPAGPLRMDSQISHFDPTSIKRIEVVKGPYALTWGAGNMSAIRVERFDADHFGRDVSGFVQTGYNSNVGAFESAGSLSGHAGDASLWIHGAYRQGNDYESGADAPVEGDFRSGELRGRLGYHLPSGGRIELTGGYNRQDDIDYPGRLLNAVFFDAIDMAGSFRKFDNSGILRGIEANLYWNGVNHGMTNKGKPTRVAGTFPNGNPRPPLIIEVDAETRNLGGRAAMDLFATDEIMFKVGGDFYSANRDARRPFFAVMPDGSRVVPPFYVSDQVWPDVTITDIGVFGNATRTRDETSVSATIRLDLVDAGAGNPSGAYLETVGADDASDLDATETNVSGALTISHRLESDWTVAAGAGSVVRTADALERYSDRVPASKSQTSAEFLGNPDLAPERATQADLWLDGAVGSASVGVSVFARRMSDYITVAPTNIQKLLPLSPDVVFRYVNGEATFYGAEGSLSVPIGDNLSGAFSAGWIKGEDETLSEPALGVAPWKMDTSLRYEWPQRRFFGEATLHVVGDQDRVATTRGERPTDGNTTIDVRLGWSPRGTVSVLAGVNNLLDEAFVNHLNASNPFTNPPRRIPEPGRVVFLTLRVSF